MIQFKPISSKGASSPASRPVSVEVGEDALFRHIFENAGSGMALVTMEGRWFRINPALCRLLGYAPSEMRQRTFQEMTHSDDLAASLDDARSLLTGAESSRQIEKRYMHRDGHPVWVRRTLSLIRDARGEPLYFFAHIEGAGEAMRASEALRQSEERFRLIAACAPIGIFLVDPQGDVLYTNPKAEEITGLTRDICWGEKWQERLHPEDRDRVTGAWARSVRDGVPFLEEMRLIGGDGKVHWLQADMAPLRADDGKIVGYVGTSVDIDVIKNLQRKLVDQNAALEVETARALEANRLKSEFLAGMSHELRTPLNGIIGFSELLHDEKAGALNPTQVEFSEHVLQSAHHLLSLINDILDIAKIEAGRMEIFPEPFRLGEVVDEVKVSLYPLLQRKGLSCPVEIALEDDAVVLDRQKFTQILRNLLSNAIKFTPQGGTVSVRAASCGEDAFELSVRDTGVGIPPSAMDRLFHEFEQVDPRRDGQGHGTGLGLALVRKFVLLQQGTIHAESQEGRGTVFRAVLPRRLS